MFVTLKRIALVSSLIGLIVLVGGIIYYKNLANYTASLDTRPFNMGLVGTVETFEPALITNHEEKLVASSMYEGLVVYDEAEKLIKPCLAKSWKYGADGKSLILTLKSNVKFHNGKPFTAQDVKDAWENSFSTTKDWTNVSLFMSISGTSDRLEGKNADISGIVVVDKTMLKVVFDEPNAAFISMLTNPVFWVYDIEDKVENRSGTGPFIFKEKKEPNQLLLLRNEKYHVERPRIAALNIKLYQDNLEAFGEYKNGKLDYLDEVPLAEIKNVKNSDKYKPYYIDKPLLEIYALGFNVNQEPYTGDYLLRRALNYAIDRKAIAEEVFGGTYRPARAVLPVGINAYNTEMRGYTYDPEKARLLLEEADHPMGEGLKPIIITYNNDEGHKMIAESIAQQLMELGLQVNIQAMDWEYYKKQLGKMEIDCFRLGWYADYPDADSFLYSLYHSSKIGISNYSNYHNPQVDKILDASRAENKSQQERIKLLKRAEEIIVDDAPNLWLFQKQANKLISKDINKLEVNSMGMLNWHEIELLKPSIDEETSDPDNPVKNKV
ncbi:MAG TPA: ABC transporter substrate-binding protein [Syntrophomonadaceae bacterium]|nr:ABC transporter substrate-binding protein [Syntrophomonadaceae bacterium]